MRSKSNDFFSTILMLIPLVAVPMLAIFGIPEIAPVKKSALNENEAFSSEGASQSQFEEISFGASSHEIGLGDEGNLTGRSRSGQGNSFEKMAAGSQGSSNREQWLPPAGALEGWELDTAPSKIEPDRKNLGLASAEPLPKQELGNNSIQQLGFDRTQSSQGSANPFEREIQQVGNEQSQFEPAAPADQSAVKEVDEQFRVRAETMLRRDPATWSAAVQKLNELGIRDYRLEPGVRPNEFLFSCSYSPPHNPRISRRFESEALDPLKAVIRVLQQVDEWNPNR
tara:strand:+ start:13404 stop:14252 length:849 start_codon:yes stop_codon:yes gene_type:complete